MYRGFKPALVLCTAVVVSAACALTAKSQDSSDLDESERVEIVRHIGVMLNKHYVFPEIATECADHLQAVHEAGVFDELTSPQAFATSLTTTLQSVSHDKHMRVRLNTRAPAADHQADQANAQALQAERVRRNNYGFNGIERFEGNIGYIDLRSFSGSPDASTTAAAVMGYLANSDALIYDLRNNGGGSPEMVRFLCSYLFDEPTHLNSLYWRQGDVTQEFWTQEVPGLSMASVPVFVLTSQRTFSAAEEFTYNLSTRKRATIVGETTGGGANPGGSVPINRRFSMFVPTGRAINPITGTNWEGVGVVPDVAVEADTALETSLELARVAAQTYRDNRAEAVAKDWNSYEVIRSKAASLAREGKTNEAIAVLADGLEAAAKVGILAEMDFNRLGYELMEQGLGKLAIGVFEFNVSRYPDSANVYDSLGEAYMANEQYSLAIHNYRTSLEHDPTNDHAKEMIAQMLEIE